MLRDLCFGEQEQERRAQIVVNGRGYIVGVIFS